MRKKYYNILLKAAVLMLVLLVSFVNTTKANTYVLTSVRLDGANTRSYILIPTQTLQYHHSTIRTGSLFLMDNSIFVLEIDSSKLYTEGGGTSGTLALNSHFSHRAPTPFHKLEGNTFGKYIRQFSKIIRVSGFDFARFINNNVDLSLYSKNISNCNVLKVYTEKITENNDSRTLYHLIPPKDTIPGSGGKESNVLNIIISENATIVAQPNDISECVGGNQQMTFAISGGTGNITYQWQVSSDGINFTDVPGANSTIFTPPSATPATSYYRVVISSDVNGCGPVTSTAAAAVVMADPVVSVSAIKDVICEGESASLTAAVSGGSGTTTYQWQSSTDGSTWQDVSGATTDILTTPYLTVSTQYRVIVKQGSGCQTISAPLEIKMGSCNGSIGNLVWLDCNKNGIQEPNEKGIAGVVIKLQGKTANGENVNESISSEPNGNYRFRGVKPGKYRVVFGFPPNMTGLGFTPKKQNNDVVDSDAGADGYTEEITFNANQVIDDLDAGYVDVTPPVVTQASDIVLVCNGQNTETELKNWLDSHGGANATDNFTTDVIWTHNYSGIRNDCAGSGEATVTFTASDDCGNKQTTVATVKFIDNQPPVFANTPATVRLKCGDKIDPPITPSVSDLCDPAPTVILDEKREDLCGSSFKLIRTWTATDACGNAATTTQEILLEDKEAPQFRNVPGALTLACNDPIPPGSAVIALDNCDGNPKVTMSDLIERGICNSSYKINRMWTAVDACGNLSKATQVITIGDNSAPQITGVPADMFVTCGSQIGSPSRNVRAFDNCSPDVRLSVNDRISRGPCTDSYIVARTWTATDACGNVTTKTQRINVNDNIKPELINVPADMTVKLYLGQRVPTRPNIVATDNCDSRVDIEYTETRENNLCGYVLKRKWRATDNCRNVDEKTQVITVRTAENNATITASSPENCNEKNGRVQLSPSTPDYSYRWSDGKTGYLRTDLAAGSYKVTATSSANCSIELTVIVKRECDCERPVVSVSKQDLTCSTTEGGATINVANGLPADLKFIWSPNVANSNKATNLKPGNYTVRVERANKASCFTEVNFTIRDNQYVEVQEPAITHSSCNTSSGGIRFIVSPNDSLNFKWADTQTNAATRTGLASGTYTVTISRPNSSACPLVKNIEILSDNPLRAPYVINRQPSCGLPNGAVTINTSGGSGNYKYSWGEGNSRFVLPSGPINVTVTDIQTGCFTVVSFVLTDQSPAATVTMDSIFRVSCLGIADGRAIFNVAYGTDFKLPAKFEIRDLNNNLYSNGGLPIGNNYNLMIKDSSGCLATSKVFSIINPPAIVPSFTKINQTCDILGSIKVTVTGGTGAYKYAWADLGYQNDQPAERVNLKAGTYSVTITDGLGCPRVLRNIRVLDSCACRPAVVDNIDVANAHCGQSDGALTLKLINGTEADYTYAWSTTAGVPSTVGNSRIGLASGSYTVTITSKKTLSCTTVVKVAVGTTEGPKNVGIDVSPATCEAADGAAAFSSSEALTYTWLLDGKKESARHDLKTGVYQVLVTRNSAPNCPSVLTVKIGSANKLEAVAIVKQKATCGTANGIAAIRIEGGSGQYQYSWGTDSVRNNLKAGVYVVYITDKVTNCKTSVTLSMPEETTAEAAITITNSVIHLSCYGNRNGKVNYRVGYGNGFAYPAMVNIVDDNGRIWSNDSLPAGNYCIIVKDATGCVAASSCFEVREPAPLTAIVTKDNKNCFVGGRITLTVKGGSGLYQFAWSDKSGLSQDNSRSGLNIGSYSVTVYDSKGCSIAFDTIRIATDCPNEVNYCDGFTASVSTTNMTCTEGGKILLTVSGGTAPYSFDWADLELTNNPQNRFSLQNGTYSVTVTDAAGCTKQLNNIIINNTCSSQVSCVPPVISDIKITDASCAKATGEIIVSVSNALNVVYKWFPAVSNSNTAQNLVAGVYKLKIYKANDSTCFTERDIIVKNQDGINVSQPTITPATCAANNGKVEFSGLGKPLLYQWSDGKIGSIRTDLPKGIYTITVTDPAGDWCTQIIRVEVPTINSLTAAAMIDNRSICGQATGQATIKPVGGSGSYSYSWGNSATKGGLKSGTYQVTVTDNQTGCTTTVIFTMTDEVQGFATVNVAQPIVYLACAGENNASVVYNLTYSSGFEMPSRVVITDNLGRAATNDNLGAGRYTIFVYDKNNCLAGLGNFEVRESPILMIQASAAPQLCSRKGGINVSVSGGSGVYTYQWADLTVANQPSNRTELYAGDYYLTVTDSRGCSKVSQIKVRNEAIACQDSCDLQAFFTASPKTCTEGGSVSLTVLNGSGTYGYLWSDLGNTSAQPRDRKDLNAGTYTVTIIDSTTNCKVKLLDIIIENKAVNCPVTKCTIISNADVRHKFCEEAGSIRLTVKNGIRPFTFDWLDLPGTDNPQNRFNLLAGQYTLIVTDSVGCKDTLNRIVVKDSCFAACSVPVVGNISVTDASCFGSDGAIAISMLGSNSAYVYKWLPEISKSNIATGLASRVYKVRIARAEDTLCFVEKDILVNSKNDALVLGAPTVIDATCGLSNGAVTINAPQNWTYRWNDGATGRSREFLAPNTYYVTVTDPSVSGCPKVQEIVVRSVGGLQVSSRVDRQPECGLANGQVTILVKGGSGNYIFSWGTAVRSNLKAGLYNVMVYDVETGCKGNISVSLTDKVVAGAIIKINTTQFTQKCKGDANTTIDYTITYADGFTQPAVVKIIDETENIIENGQLKAGKYKIVVSDANGCIAAAQEFELADPEIISTQMTITPATCDVLGSIILSVRGGAGNYSYDWVDLAGTQDTEDRTGLQAGKYAVTVKDANGCTVVVKDLIVGNICSTAKPKRDTVYKNMTVSRTDTVCVPFDAALAGQILNYSLCDGNTSSVDNVAMVGISQLGCISVKAGRNPGRKEICVIGCNSVGICDTTLFIVSINGDPSVCATSYLGESTVSVSKCDSLAVVCTDIAYSKINDYIVTINDVPSQFYTNGCRKDSSFVYSYFALTKFYPNGPWDLDSWVMDGKEYKGRFTSLGQLVDSLNKWDGSKDWFLNTVNKTIVGGSTARSYGSMTWKRSGRRVTTLIPAILEIPSVLSLRLPVGTHKVVFTDRRRNCQDSTTIKVICTQQDIVIGGYTIDTLIYIGTKDTICLNNSAWAAQSTITNVCSDIYKGHVGYTVDEATDCIRISGTGVGRDTLCLKRTYYDGRTDTVRLLVTVKPSPSPSDTDCIDVYTGPEYFNIICGTKAQICTNLNGADTLNYIVTVNGTLYRDGFTGCTGDTSISYNYYSLVVTNPRGPWRLNPWIVNGNTYSGIIPNINALVDSMNKWDAGGNWVLDGATYTIKGGKSGSNYGNMTWYKNNTSTKIASLGPNRLMNIGQIGMLLGSGRHQIIFYNIQRNCSDTANILIECRQLRTRPSMTIRDTTVFVNETNRLCLFANGLMASATKISTICNTKGYMNYVVDDANDCVMITGANVGKDTICLQRCDFDGECDTVKIVVEVLKRNKITTETVFHTVTMGRDSQYCVNTNELMGRRFTVKNICDNNGNNNVSFLINGTCINYFADGLGIDTACLVTCDELGNCDTTKLIIYVKQELQKLPNPVAVRDFAMTTKTAQVVIKPINNDSLFGLPSNIMILVEPQNGRLSFDPETNNVVYSPIQGTDCINRDSFRYAVINIAGQDTAEVAVEILCDELVVFSGFSPNGDGVNDSFTILGLEKFPDSKLFIFNQRGNQVFEATDYQNNWNGTADGVVLPNGTYYWVIDLGNSRKQSGYLQIHK